jgi:hypothetical protein
MTFYGWLGLQLCKQHPDHEIGQNLWNSIWWKK